MRNQCATLCNGVSLYLSPQILIPVSNYYKNQEFKNSKLKVRMSLLFDFEMLKSGLLSNSNYHCCFGLYRETGYLNLFNFAMSWRPRQQASSTTKTLHDDSKLACWTSWLVYVHFVICLFFNFFPQRSKSALVVVTVTSRHTVSIAQKSSSGERSWPQKFNKIMNSRSFGHWDELELRQK